MKIIYLEWHDAFCNPEWMTRQHMEEVVCKYEAIIRQVGFLVEENKKYIVVAGSWKPEHKYGEAQFTNIHKIPKTWIRNREILMKIK